MAGQRARTSYQDAGPRTEDPAVPAQRSRAAGGDADPAREARAQRGGASRRRQQARRRGGPLAALTAVGLPLVGGIADELSGPGAGILFAVGAVLGTGLAALLCSRAGRWWVVTAAPVVVLLTASGVEYLCNPDKYQGKGLGTGAVRWMVGAFPVMAEAVAVVLLVIVVRAVLERRRPARAGAPSGRGRRG
ncbi:MULTISPECIES: DUF6542 domain-containing protein [Kitasatospora]|uniref:DUF6542 domain-containing protein n=1 Tax=Kitasatospora cathayae TaxID=3004092 RepID=A0ABY7QDN8_9ACTN|nr:DUF6542 domain-containing protein [Kitasatospora sp. HUAS 3-15]WBP90857.1 hypothetical protein O1G21_36665 [Kitasatospora sp. HUAS 3-15]